MIHVTVVKHESESILFNMFPREDVFGAPIYRKITSEFGHIGISSTTNPLTRKPMLTNYSTDFTKFTVAKPKKHNPGKSLRLDLPA